MKTHIKSIHEEQYSDGSKTLGMLLNYSSDLINAKSFKESFPFIYKEGMYIFFETMVDLFDYLLYGEKKMKRAYMEEIEFDKHYEAHSIEGEFKHLLNWL